MRDYAEVFVSFVRDSTVFEYHGVEKLLACTGIAVSSEYLGLGICEHFIRGRTEICEEFGIKITSANNTSEYSNRVGDKTGFKIVNYGQQVKITVPYLKISSISIILYLTTFSDI